MCGSVRMSWMEQAIFLDPGSMFPNQAIYPNPNFEVRMSQNRFIRDDSINWWKRQMPLYPVALKIESYDEKGNKIVVPEGYGFKGYIHREGDKHVLSIVTIDPARTYEDSNINEVAKVVRPIHNRMPMLIKLPHGLAA